MRAVQNYFYLLFFTVPLCLCGNEETGNEKSG
jgi:hypothetical protein